MAGSFAQPFRDQVARWLVRIGPSPGTARRFSTGAENVVVVDHLRCPAGFQTREVLVVRGDLTAGPGCRFEGPVWAGGSCEIGKGGRVMALAAGKDVLLGAGADVTEWVDAQGSVEMRAGVNVAGPVASAVSVRLGEGASAAGLVAQSIESAGCDKGMSGAPLLLGHVAILPPSEGVLPDLGSARLFRPERLSSLDGGTWVYDGHLFLTRPLLLRSALIVRGSVSFAGSSLIEGALTGEAEVRLGRGCQVRAAVSAGGDMRLDEDCAFSADVQAGGRVHLAAGVRGYREQAPVCVTGAEVVMDENVQVRGIIQAGTRVIHARPEAGLAEDLKSRYLALANG